MQSLKRKGTYTSRGTRAWQSAKQSTPRRSKHQTSSSISYVRFPCPRVHCGQNLITLCPKCRNGSLEGPSAKCSNCHYRCPGLTCRCGFVTPPHTIYTNSRKIRQMKNAIASTPFIFGLIALLAVAYFCF